MEPHRIDRHPLRLDLRQVQDIVENLHQGCGRRLHQREVLVLVRGERRFERQRRQADDAVHRGPDLVAHVGEEFTLHAARFFRRATRLVELVRLILELPHQFPRQANGADQPRAQPLRRPRGQRDVEIRAVQQRNLEDLGRPGDVPVLEELELEQHRHIRGDRQVAERQRPPETGIHLIRRPDEEE